MFAVLGFTRTESIFCVLQHGTLNFTMVGNYPHPTACFLHHSPNALHIVEGKKVYCVVSCEDTAAILWFHLYVTRTYNGYKPLLGGVCECAKRFKYTSSGRVLDGNVFSSQSHTFCYVFPLHKTVFFFNYFFYHLQHGRKATVIQCIWQMNWFLRALSFHPAFSLPSVFVPSLAMALCKFILFLLSCRV